MRPSEIKRIKDPYRLWYEYLKRSKKYKKLCAAMQAGRSLEPTEENLKLLDAYYSWGDVFVNSFVESYKKFKRNRSPVTREAVTDYKAEFRNEAMNIIENYKNETGRAITSPELVNRIERDFKRQTIVLKIDPTGGSDEEIMTKVKEALEEKRSQHSTKALQLLECVNCRLTTDNPNIEYLKTCLIVYDLRMSGMIYREIIEAFGHPKHGDFTHSFRRYYAAAKKLIENTEKGLFPHDYRPDAEEPYEHRVRI